MIRFIELYSQNLETNYSSDMFATDNTNTVYNISKAFCMKALKDLMYFLSIVTKKFTLPQLVLFSSIYNF